VSRYSAREVRTLPDDENAEWHPAAVTEIAHNIETLTDEELRALAALMRTLHPRTNP
jgi:hypothetical protein